MNLAVLSRNKPVIAGVVVGLAAAAVPGALYAQHRAGDQEAASGPERIDTRPNVVVIQFDDAAIGDINPTTMPTVTERIVDQGASFDESIVSFSYCCPSRASLLTGTYAHENGMLSCKPPYGYQSWIDNTVEDETMPALLERSGYQTGFTGKFLNAYDYSTPEESVPEGWTDWKALHGGTYRAYNWSYNDNGEVKQGQEGKHQTFGQTDLVKQQIDQFSEADDPFYLQVSYVTPHHGRPQEADDPPDVNNVAVPRRYRNRYEDRPMPRSPAFNVTGPDKNKYVAKREKYGPGMVAQITEAWRQRQEAMRAADDAIKQIIRRLRQTDELDDTVFVVTSDNGYTLGDMRKTGKLDPYMNATSVPLVMAGPGIPKGRSYDQVVQNIDLTASVLDLAGIPVPPSVAGESFLPVFDDPRWGLDRVALLEQPPPTNFAYVGVRTQDHTYLEADDGVVELYDLRTDPWELTNLAGRPAYRPVQRALAGATDRLRDCEGSACRMRLDVPEPLDPPPAPPGGQNGGPGGGQNGGGQGEGAQDGGGQDGGGQDGGGQDGPAADDSPATPGPG